MNTQMEFLDRAVRNAWDDQVTTFVRIHGPADRHGVIEWTYDVGTFNQYTGYITLGAWSEDNAMMFETAAGVSTPGAAKRIIVERAEIAVFPEVDLVNGLAKMFNNVITRFNDIMGQIHKDERNGTKPRLEVEFVMERPTDASRVIKKHRVGNQPEAGSPVPGDPSGFQEILPIPSRTLATSGLVVSAAVTDRKRHLKEYPTNGAVIVAAVRSPIGRAMKGAFKDTRPEQLTAMMVQAALDKVPELDPRTIDDLLLGCGMPGGQQGWNMARVVAVMMGLDNVPGATITRYCSSSVQTTRMAMHAIRAGEGHTFISAGVEIVSGFPIGGSDAPPVKDGPKGRGPNPYLNPIFDDAHKRSLERAKGEPPVWHDPREDGQLPDYYVAMGQTAENVATYYDVSRADQDEFALRSQTLAAKALVNGFWAKEITPITFPDGSVMDADESPRAQTTLEGLAGLKPVFQVGGTVTAGNAAPLTDGAAALVVMSDTRAAELGIIPLARVVATGVSALSPEIMGLGPIESTRNALANAGMSIGDIDLFELNEVFAAQAIPSYRELKIDIDKLNVHGGSIALGNPFGMTGARITNTLLNGLRERDGTFGLETTSVAGGQGMAIIFERLS